jgi:chemotaxis protein MotD
LPAALPPAFGDDFAAVLAGLAPTTPVAQEASPPQHAQPANDRVAQAAPVQPQPRLRTRPAPAVARTDSKPTAKVKPQAGNASTARAADTPKSAASDSDEENATTVAPVAAARPASAPPKIDIAVKSIPSPKDSLDIAPVYFDDNVTDDPANAPALPSAADAKPISPQALADIVAAARNAQQAAAVVPDDLLKMPAGAQVVAADASAKLGAKDIKAAPSPASVILKSAAPAPLPVVADKTVRALSDIAANESQASELSSKTSAGQTDDTQQQDASPDRRDAPQTNASGPAAKAEVALQPAPPPQAAPGGQMAMVTPPVLVAAPAASATAPATVAPQSAAEELTNVTDLGAVIAAKSAAGAKSFEIRLDPAELGRVEIKLTVGADGKADATIVAHRPETLALLLRDSQNLERTLRESGLDVSNSSLNFSLKGQERQGDGGGASKAHRRTLSDAVVARSEAANASIASLSLAPSSARLDIRV